MSTIIVVLICGIFFKTAAIIISIRLIRVTKSYKVSVLISFTALLMIIRSSINIHHYIIKNVFDLIDIQNAVFTFFISLFLLLSSAYMHHLFIKIKQREDELAKSKRNYQNLVDVSPAGIFSTDYNGNYTYVNQQLCDIVMLSSDKLIGKEWTDIVHQDDRERVLSQWNKCLDGNMFFRDEFSLQTSNSPKKWVIVQILAEKDLFDETQTYIGTIIDITQRKLDAEKIKDTLKEKELLVREVHHRTKNNLALISGLIRIQSEYVEQHDCKEILTELISRINTMSLIHESLCQTENLSEIAFDKYLKALMVSLIKTYSSKTTRISLNLDLDDVSIAVKQAVPLGLAINEMATNSLKHAFPNISEGIIAVIMRKINDEIYLTFSDNGIGISEDIDLANIKSMGVLLIMNIVKNQLNGNIVMNKSNGTEYRITIKYRNDNQIIE
ncbi:MAG: PAS domain S-box protein [Nitrospirae bacterium]|nr:PAS domain S-box protein [Nitrospirota bacterium]